MVNIGGLNLQIPGGSAGALLTKSVSLLFWSAMIIIVVGLIGFFGYRWYRNKASYTNNVTLTWYYDNGTSKTMYGLRGGRFINRHGVWDFRIMIPKQFKKKELGYTPDFSKADADGTLHFITSGDGSIWQQASRKLVTKERAVRTVNGVETVYEYDILIQPVRTDVKTVTVNSLKNWSEMMNKNKVTVFAIGFGMILIMVIAHLISLYVQTKIKCPGV